MASKKNELTGDALKKELWSTLLGVKKGSVKTDQANSIAAQSREICRIVKLQLDAARLVGKPTKAQISKIVI